MDKSTVPRSFSLSARDKERAENDLEESKCGGFSSFTGAGIDSDFENDDNFENVDCENDSEGARIRSNADPLEVDRVCKVIDELFALDRNMEAVLDECEINLSHDLVIDVLERFCHARKPAFRFFCWAGQKQGFVHDSRTYNSMMSILGKSRQFETMVSMLEEMGEKGLLTMDTFSIAMRAFAAAKERKKAVGIFELMKKHKYKVGVETINSLLDSLGRAKLGKEAQALFDKLEDRFTPNMQTYTVLLNGWCRVKNLMEAGRIWNEMIDKGFKPDVVAHNVMLEGLLKSKKMSEAIKLLMVMKSKGPSPDVWSYTKLIRALCKQSKMNEAVEYFDEMVDSGCRPDAAIYTCLITGFGNQRRMDMVSNLLKEMKDEGCPPDGRTYNALIKLLTSRNRPDDAEKIYMKMVQSGIEPTIHTYNMIMKSYFQIRNFEMGRAVWDEMSRKGFCPDGNSYTVFINGLISQGRSAEACKYLEEMLEKGMKAPELDYSKFVADFSRLGKPFILEELAKKLKFSGKNEASNVLAGWAEMMKRRFKRRDLAF
ncbi:pentatricopeptide repeat-containing protein At3g62470, mitochondrial-like isoform X2 [Euphorbia lathyris]|uniref:pentatricopeptide repeat-containing protein At3g62470, mitochondrial-like isoform X2 n=1 Tax=Euphorbia lathyris TaxID=212925 RepID=UPI0033133E2A